MPGTRIWQGCCASAPDAIANALKIKAPNAVRIGLETGPLCTWHWHALKHAGFPVVYIHATHAKAALKSQMKRFDGHLGIIAVERKLSTNGRQIVELYQRSFRETLRQILRDCLSLRRIPGKSQRQRRSILGFPVRRNAKRSRGALPRFWHIVEKSFYQSACGYIDHCCFLLLRDAARVNDFVKLFSVAPRGEIPQRIT